MTSQRLLTSCRNLLQALAMGAFMATSMLGSPLTHAAVSLVSNISIKATGAGQDSDILIQGSTIDAGKAARLKADGDIALLASQDQSVDKSSNKSSGMSVGVSLGKDTGVTLGASKGKGGANGESTTYHNTSIKAGEQVSLESGGDTSLKGAIISAPTVNASIGGNLTIESLQDTSSYQSQQKSASASLTIGAGAGGSLSASKSNITSSYQSVGQQSAIRAGGNEGASGTGGFNINVAGNTTLTGGQITSSQKAIDEGKNNFTTGGSLTITDLQNSASYKASAASLTVGTSGGGAGVGQASEQAASVSTGGISGLAGNKAARTGDQETGIQPIFDKVKAAELAKDINAQVAITTQFGQQASQFVGDLGAAKTKPIEDAKKYQALKDKEAQGGKDSLSQADQNAIADLEKGGMNADQAKANLANPQYLQDYENWKEGGSLKVLTHAIVGGLTSGNLSGAIGAGTSQAAIPIIGEHIAELDIPAELKKILIQGAGIAIGAATGGTAGAATAQNATANNYLTHKQFKKKEQALANAKTDKEKQSINKQYDALNAQQDKLLLDATAAKDAYGLAKTPEEKQAAYEQLKAVTTALMGTLGQLKAQEDSSKPIGQALLSTYTTMQSAAGDLGIKPKELTLDEKKLVGTQWADIGMAADAADSSLGFAALKALKEPTSGLISKLAAAVEASTGTANTASGVTKLPEVAAPPATPPKTTAELPALTDGTANSAYSSAGTTYSQPTYTNATTGQALPDAATSGSLNVPAVKTAGTGANGGAAGDAGASPGRGLSVTYLDPATGVATINPTTSVSGSQISRLSSGSTAATHEIQVAAQLENATGSTIKMLEKPPANPDGTRPKSPDFVFESGPNAGKTGDFMFTAEPTNVPFMNANFDRNWSRTEVSLNAHLTKADIVVLDFTNLTPVNQLKVNDWINTLTPAQRAQILIRR